MGSRVKLTRVAVGGANDDVNGESHPTVPDDEDTTAADRKRAMAKLFVILPLCIVILATLLSFVMSKLVNTDRNSTALLIIDVQNCFTSGGTLAVSDADAVIPVINRLRSEIRFDVVMATQDWHCPNHVSFASQHPGCKIYESVNLTYLETGELCSTDGACLTNQSTAGGNCSVTSSSRTIRVTQLLWPDHCIMNTNDAQFNPILVVKPSDIVVRKGFRCQIDSYSGFYDNGHVTSTELNRTLSERNVKTVFIVGIATDFCVYYTAKDAVNLGYETYVILDATRWVAAPSLELAISDMKRLGIQLINSTQVASLMPVSSSTSSYSSPLVVIVTCAAWMMTS